MNFSYTVDKSVSAGQNDRFWAACGLDSLYHLLFTESGERLMERMQCRGTLRYVRNHYALTALSKDGFDDCGGDVYSEDETGKPVYDFSRINAVYARCLSYGVKPIVELDFMPDALCRQSGSTGGAEEGRHFNRSYPNDWDKWANLLTAFVRNLAETFGVEEVRTWYFEVWNEPDSWPVADWPMFHRMYDVFVSCVTGVDERFRVGGPGTFTLPFLKDFLEHVANGTNYVTGRRGTRIDFISHHIYGMSGGWLDEWPLIMPMVQRFNQQLMWVSRLINEYPSLREVPFHLNEWGVCSNYERDCSRYPMLEIRNSEFSALFMVKLTDCVRRIRRAWGLKLELMLYWGFCMEDERGVPFAGNRDLMTAGHIPKPILSACELLAQMGDEALNVEGSRAGGALGAMAAASGNGVQVLCYHFDETDLDAEGPASRGSVLVRSLEAGRYRVSTTRLDRTHNNTYRAYQAGGTEAALEAAELLPDDVREADCSGEMMLDIELPAHGMCLIRLEKI